MNENLKKIHIGERIKEVFDQKKMSIAQFAASLHCDRANVYNIFRRKKIDIHLLLDISEILQHNFLAEICAGHEFAISTSLTKIYFVIEINSMDTKTLNTFTKMLKQLEIKSVHEMKN